MDDPAYTSMPALRLGDQAWVVTALHPARERGNAAILGLSERVRQAGLAAAARHRGEGFRPALCRPLHEVLHHNAW